MFLIRSVIIKIKTNLAWTKHRENFVCGVLFKPIIYSSYNATKVRKILRGNIKGFRNNFTDCFLEWVTCKCLLACATHEGHMQYRSNVNILIKDCCQVKCGRKKESKSVFEPEPSRMTGICVTPEPTKTPLWFLGFYQIN